MSRAPYVQLKAPQAFETGAPDMADSVLGWRFTNPAMQSLYPPISLGMTAEVVAEQDGITREAQDAFALRSHERAVAAQKEDRFAAELAPLDVPADARKRSIVTVSADEGPRSDTSMEALGRLRPVFKEGGTVTAGNSSPMNDGAAALLLATEPAAASLGLEPMARIVSSAAAGVHPDVMGIGPVPATRKALDRAGLEVSDIGLVELNEAFAAQSVACVNHLGFSPDIVNVDGGAIALGHPLGASGARILTTLVHAMRRYDVHRGVATMCIGVGQGIAVVVEQV